MYRVEDKYQLTNQEMFILEKRISAILESDYYSGNDGYEITSLYFDDLYDTCLADTLDGIDERDKYRIRIYNDDFSTINLEIKHKLHNRIKKESCKITYEEYQLLREGNPVCREAESPFAADLPTALIKFNYAIVTQGLRPKVVVSYKRNAYVCTLGNVRITFDRNVRATNNISMFGVENTFQEYVALLGDTDSCILEVKYDEFIPDYVAGILELGSLWQTAYSKYALCRNVEELV